MKNEMRNISPSCLASFTINYVSIIILQQSVCREIGQGWSHKASNITFSLQKVRGHGFISSTTLTLHFIGIVSIESIIESTFVELCQQEVFLTDKMDGYCSAEQNLKSNSTFKINSNVVLLLCWNYPWPSNCQVELQSWCHCRRDERTYVRLLPAGSFRLVEKKTIPKQTSSFIAQLSSQWEYKMAYIILLTTLWGRLVWVSEWPKFTHWTSIAEWGFMSQGLPELSLAPNRSARLALLSKY